MKTKNVLCGFAIAVLDRGFVYVGQVEVADEWVTITDAKNLRKWGTTRGLGQLAREGPTGDTVLDCTTTVRVPLHALMHLHDTEAHLWKPR